jgi:hypothetical protein
MHTTDDPTEPPASRARGGLPLVRRPEPSAAAGHCVPRCASATHPGLVASRRALPTCGGSPTTGHAPPGVGGIAAAPHRRTTHGPGCRSRRRLQFSSLVCVVRRCEPAVLTPARKPTFAPLGDSHPVPATYLFGWALEWRAPRGGKNQVPPTFVFGGPLVSL